jgi:hypothetical protein
LILYWCGMAIQKRARRGTLCGRGWQILLTVSAFNAVLERIVLADLA